MKFENLTGEAIASALEVHRELGPGLLESSYQACMIHELSQRDLEFRTEVPIPIEYKDILLDCGYRMDIVVEDTLLIELKSQETLLPIHKAQTLTYMKLAKLPVGLLINFNTLFLRDGIKRLINTKK